MTVELITDGVHLHPALFWPPPRIELSICNRSASRSATFALIRAGAYRNYRAGRDAAGTDLPDGLTEVITAVTPFADPLIKGGPRHSWNPTTRNWT